MTKSEIASLGGKIMAKRQRAAAVKRYYQNPNRCGNCGKIIRIGGKRIPDIRKKKYCDQSCAAQYRNRYNKRAVFYCEICDSELKTNRRFCNNCLSQIRSQKAKELWAGKSKINLELTFKNLIEERGYFNARSSLAKHARYVFQISKRKRVCRICGYSLHIEVCHIKDVSKFPETAKIGEINNLDNLVPLCRNHHWELDNGYIKL